MTLAICTKIAKMLTPPADLDFKIDEEHYGLIVDVTNRAHLTEQRLNRFIIIQIMFYCKENCQGQRIIDLFEKYFKK
jgi:hypothetical protein